MHFRKAGEIKGEPAIHATAKSMYAHVNFYDPAADCAVRDLNGSVMDGTSITVKLAKKSAPNETEKVVSKDNHNKVLKLKTKQWNALMLVNESGTKLFEELTDPYKYNQSVLIKPVFEENAIKFTGKHDAVESAFSFFQKQLKKHFSGEHDAMESAFSFFQKQLKKHYL